MLTAMATAPPPKKRAGGLYTIIFIKAGKAVLLLLVSLGIYSLMGEDLRVQFEHFLQSLNLDPEAVFFVHLGDQLQKITPQNIRWLASGTFLYSALLFCESIGLMCRAYWAMWLAIGETAFFIPIEIFELVRKFSLVVSLILVINIAIVCYLVRNRNRLFHHRAAHTETSEEPESP